MDIQNILLIVFSFIIIYLIFDMKKSEYFETSSDLIINSINNTYKIDIDSVRNLSGIAKKIFTQDKIFRMPATNTTSKNMKIKNNISVNGNIIFENKDNLNIIQEGIILEWWSSNINDTIPKGWAICDGEKYSLDNNGNIMKDNVFGIKTPDLRGRFIIGAGKNQTRDLNGNIISELTNRPLNEYGGEETVQLQLEEIPSHTHTIDGYQKPKLPAFYVGGPGFTRNNRIGSNDAFILYNKSAPEGNNQPHNNMPPFYVLYHIMKISTVSGIYSTIQTTSSITTSSR